MFRGRNLGKTALVANGLVWFGLALFFAGLAGEATIGAFHGQWFNILGWCLLVAVAIGFAVVGIVENRKIRAKRRESA